MNDKRYSLEEIRETLITGFTECKGEVIVDPEEFANSFINDLTRTEQEFSEGQVVICEGPNHYGYYRVGRQPDKATEGTFIEQARALNIEEVGPHLYVPIEDVRPLVEFFRKIDQCAADGRSMTDGWLGDLCANTVDALPDNLKALID